MSVNPNERSGQLGEAIPSDGAAEGASPRPTSAASYWLSTLVMREEVYPTSWAWRTRYTEEYTVSEAQKLNQRLMMAAMKRSGQYLRTRVAEKWSNTTFSRRQSQGLCPTCGCRAPKTGRTKCFMCLASNSKRVSRKDADKVER